VGVSAILVLPVAGWPGAYRHATSEDAPEVRDASKRGGEACAAIYAHYVIDTAVTFETDPPTPAEMAERIARAAGTHAWVVLEHQGRVAGYA
jgi:L-amino acid N-acyltransferase YncA